jgi:hypothetical protein
VADDLVLTPGGYRPKSVVQALEPGHRVSGANGRLRVLKPDGSVVTDLGPLPVRPGDAPLQPANVSVPKEKVPGLGVGWITYASWLNTGKPITSFKTTWMVPPAPTTQSGQTIFIFNGIQNSTMIYQPVLQWGPSAAGGGNYWAVASWYVDGGGGPAFHGSLIPVNVGQNLLGVMTLTGQSGSDFSYNCQFQGIANSGYPIENVQQLTWCIETLECYGLTKCSDYPGGPRTAMTAIEIKTTAGEADLKWQANDPVTDCGQHTVIVSNASPGGEVDIFYRSGSEQPGWRWCYKCQGMFFADNPSMGVCPADHKPHDPSKSGLYAALFGEDAAGQQGGWRWCDNCQGMFFAENPSLGVCPANGKAHDPSKSGHYASVFGEDGAGQQGNWRWCDKCQGMFFNGNASKGVCPADGKPHDGSKSGHYVALFTELT